jgi:hypothetical protein
MARRFPGIDLRQPDFASRLSQHNPFDFFWAREFLSFCLSGQSSFMLSAAAAGRNAFGMQPEDPGWTGFRGFFSEKIALRKLNPWNPVNPVQFFFWESYSLE